MHIRHLFFVAFAAFSQLSIAEPIPVEVIGKLPVFQNPMISPDGSQVATVMTVNGIPELIVQPLGSENSGDYSRIGSGEYFFSWYDWANEERLVVNIRATVGVNGRLRNLGRMASIGADGKDAVFFKMMPDNFGFYRQYAELLNKLPDEPDHILALLDNRPDDWAEPQVHKVNISTGKRKLIDANRRGFMDWVTDHDGVLRVGVKYDLRFNKTEMETWYREDEEAKWELLQETDFFAEERITPVGFARDDANILLVSTYSDASVLDGGNHIYAYDLTQREIIGPYRDPRVKRALDTVEKAFPDDSVELVSMSQDGQTSFIKVYSDTRSPEYYLLDFDTGRLDYAAAEYPELIDYQLAPMREVSYQARDGLEIPALLTIPEGADQPMPVVVYPHGGPWAHDEWGFDNYVQLLASHGYAVLQPQFRGSTGYGQAHEEAGYKQWGKGIQDDITDGTRWLVDEGIADPERICIVGGSFGGYAAAMAVAKEPELYRCAISVNGVLDLKKFIDDGDNYLFENINRKMWNDRADAEDYSPYHLARNIEAPMLLIAGERDTVVPYKHSKRMHKRLRKLKKDVEYLELPDGEHWRTSEKNELEKLRAITAFLNRHLQD